MVWFLVDDNLALHQKVNQAGNAAMGVWVRAGAWSAGNLTDGYIPSRIAHQIGTRSQIESLLKSGLWSRVTDGYQFHDWEDRQPTAEQVKQRREGARQRKAKQRAKQQPVTRDPHARGRPSPVRDLVSLPHQGDGAAARPPPARCSQCDENGYRPNGMVCDHIDRQLTAARGVANIRAAMGWKQ
jgi:hypothetical protein